MISISTTTANTSGNVVISEIKTSDTTKKQARISRSKLLDGGAYINHSGASHGDRTFSIEAQISQAESIILNAIFDTETTVLICMSDGLFLGAIDSLDTKNGNLKMNILIQQKEN